MARRKREIEVFSLAFLDVMSCGFGAIVLLFVLIKHGGEPTTVRQPLPSSETDLIEQEILEGQRNLLAIRNTVSEVDNQLVIAQGLASRIQDDLSKAMSDAESRVDTGSDVITALKDQLAALTQQKVDLDKEKESHGENLREFAGKGRREYLTGIRLGGERILVLLDTSASMLDDEIVNILRYRNMDAAAKRKTQKWQQAVRTVDWLTARFPKDSMYQIYTFSNTAQPLRDGTRGQWLDVNDAEQFEDTVGKLHDLVPDGGSSLENAFAEISRMNPRPDNIFLVTDGLPTQGTNLRTGMVSGEDRLRMFWNAVKRFPERTPLNIILLSMEGDPDAAGAFWRLGQLTGGSFVTPTEDWP